MPSAPQLFGDDQVAAHRHCAVSLDRRHPEIRQRPAIGDLAGLGAEAVFHCGKTRFLGSASAAMLISERC